ncbi:MAG: hypothetical protein DCF31_10165 [Alphaproteobacteria bacterium]|nr:MAG: hypothetical protein DCF31_10165 [Alphaproteobacteria bacterium]
MKILNISIDNFRGIDSLTAIELTDTVVIAGQNGSGKSCIFDAIKLLKSSIAGYNANEVSSFFGELQITLSGKKGNLENLFYDKAEDVSVKCDFVLRAHEKSYISDNLVELLEDTIAKTLFRDEMP